MKTTISRIAPVALAACALLAPTSAASDPIDCELTFEMSGWSAFYKTAKGTGRITCDNGQSVDVVIRAKGGGLTFGKSKIRDGFGEFTEVDRLEDLYGTYAHAEAHAGAGKSVKATVVTKGEISLAFTGKGTGVDLGVSFGRFDIQPASVGFDDEEEPEEG